MPSHYLVTGAAGFIASRITTLLLEQGHAVTGVDNLNDAYDVRLKHWRLARLQSHPGFTFHHADISQRDAVSAFMPERCDAVINLAARAGVRQSLDNPWAYVDTNITGALNLLEACRVRGIKKYVLASTSSAYGASTAIPFREDTPTDRPISPYAASKKAAETLCYTYHHAYGLDISILRYFTVYGPAGRPDMSLFLFVQWTAEEKPVLVYGDGEQTRDFTFADDIALGTIAALKPLGYEIINLGSDAPVTVSHALRTIEGLLGKQATVRHAPRHPADVPATWADIGKAQRLLGWRPQTSFQDGVAQLVAWYQEQRAWAKDIATD